MSKTAEEKFKEIGVYPEDFISSSGYFGAVKAANSFAAQEVEAYKERLRIAFNEFYEESEKGRMSPGYHAGFVEARHIIDTVK